LADHPIDERQIRHEQPFADAAPHAGPPSGQPQFTLGGFILFVTSLAVCLSTAATALKIGSWPGQLLLLFSGVVLWVVMFETYRRLGLRVVLLVHWLAPAIPIGFTALYLVFNLPASAATAELSIGQLVFAALGFLLVVAAFSCLVTSLGTLVLFLARMLFLAMKPAAGRAR